MIVFAYPLPVLLDERQEPAGDPDADAYVRNASTMPLADFECRHGRLPEEDCHEC